METVRQEIITLMHAKESILEITQNMYRNVKLITSFRAEQYDTVMGFLYGDRMGTCSMAVTVRENVLMLTYRRGDQTLDVSYRYEDGELDMTPIILHSPVIKGATRTTNLSVAIVLDTPGVISTVKLTELGVKHVN